jgi:hypothetical protein
MTWIETAIKELAEEQSLELEEGKDLDDYILSYDPHGDGKNVEIDGEEWTIYKNDGDAHEGAVEYVTEMLEEDATMFNQEWLQGYLTMSDTDRRITAQEAADSYAYDLGDDERTLEEGNMTQEWETLEEEKDEGESRLFDIEDELIEADDDEEEQLVDEKSDLEDRMKAITKEQEETLQAAKEAIADEMSRDHYDRLSDPIEYFSDYGWTAQDLIERNIVSIDIEEAAEAAVDEDGVAHFMSSYDGNEVDLPSGAVAFRTN